MIDEFEVYQCPACKQPVISAVTAAAKTVVVDADFAVGGDVVLEWRGGVNPLARKVPVTGLRRTDARFRTFHTCNTAAARRRF